MSDIYYSDRITRKEEKEQVYGKIFLEILYGKKPLYRFFSFFLLPLFSKISFLSKLYGAFQKSRFSRFKIRPFIETFRIDESEFLERAESFNSFNDFFIRRLKPSARPIANGNDVAILPADGRYLVFPSFQKADGLFVKGEKFDLAELLQSKTLAEKYDKGGVVMVRLCPVDYHRFHFPCKCEPGDAKLINGALFSVNPIAVKRNIKIFSENKRMITPLYTKNFGTILYIEVGATYVGSINQTYVPGEHYAKGDEKGYFSFGGSSLILLFEPDKIAFDQDLIETTQRKIETLGQLGQTLGRALSPF